MSWGKKHSDISEASHCQTLRMLSNGRGGIEIKSYFNVNSSRQAVIFRIPTVIKVTAMI